MMMRVNQAKDSTSEPLLLDVKGVSALLNCSARHIFRLADLRRLPAPVRIGRLVRWDRRTLEQWISNGCPPVKRAS